MRNIRTLLAMKPTEVPRRSRSADFVLLTRSMSRKGGIAEANRALVGTLAADYPGVRFRVGVTDRFTAHDLPEGVEPEVFAYVGPTRSRSFFRTLLLVHRERPRAIIATDFRAFVFARLVQAVRLQPGSSVGYWLKSIPSPHGGGLTRSLVFRLLVRRSLVMSPSQSVLQARLGRWHVGRQVSLPNGVNDHGVRFVADERETFNLTYTAAMIPWKNHELLIGAVKDLVSRGYAVRLDLYGDGILRATLESESARLGLQNVIRFNGVTPRAKVALAHTDLYVHPSDGEAFGHSVVEAMLAEVPPVVFRSGAFPEMIIDGVTGFLVDEVSSRALADCLAELIDGDQSVLRAVGKAAREEAIRQYGRAAFADGFLKCVELCNADS